jgi:hypothetical protein
LEPLVLECGWCGFSNRRDETARCVNCGGPLPPIPGGDPGPEPPPVPRVIPKEYRKRVMFKKNVLVILGMVFTLVFFWSGIFLIIGIPLWIVGHKKGKRKLDALANGTPTRGRILSVAVDYSTTINNEHPWKIEFEYDTPEGTKTASTQAWDPSHQNRPVGEHIWVVYVADKLDTHAIWPPIK